jgi:hypothetical protein
VFYFLCLPHQRQAPRESIADVKLAGARALAEELRGSSGRKSISSASVAPNCRGERKTEADKRKVATPTVKDSVEAYVETNAPLGESMHAPDRDARQENRMADEWVKVRIEPRVELAAEYFEPNFSRDADARQLSTHLVRPEDRLDPRESGRKNYLLLRRWRGS